ncbi:DUF6063 family protein [Helicovermis profundi]|uniref:Non-ribosomal peptide synthetase module n=1 Tax=Helicovermis profundi TaxID=3065157 RepID=A0AAU9EHJ3_9FIRM|nr:hypothetical protein HLPR_26330 [Clostridia bacterium S502]
MKYEEKTILESFEIYSNLASKGQCLIKDFTSYTIDENVRALVDLFADNVECTVIVSSENLFLIPLAVASPFHISNESLKSKYLTSKHQVSDIYLMYFAMIVFFGLFYDSYLTIEPVLEFVSMETWLNEVNLHIASLKEHDEETLKYHESDMHYNWLLIIEKWSLIDDINEKSKVQDGRTNSHVSFLNLVKNFMLGEDLINDIGNMEYELTEKAKDIIGHYFMELEYNRGILELLYKGENDANNIED